MSNYYGGSRLLSYDEFQESSLSKMYAGYGDYLADFQAEQNRQRKFAVPQTGTSGLQFSGLGGTENVPTSGAYFGGGAMPSIGGGKAQPAAGGIPKYRTHTGLGGQVGYETRGGRQTLTGEYIPTTMEEQKQEIERQTVIPRFQMETELNLQKLASDLAQQRAAEKTPKTLIAEKQMLLKEQQFELAQQRENRLAQQFLRTQDWKEANALATREFRREMAEANAKARKELVKLNSEERAKLMNINNAADLTNALTLLDTKIAYEREDTAKKNLESIRNNFENALTRLTFMRGSISKDAFEKTKAELLGRQTQAVGRADQEVQAVTPPTGAKRGRDPNTGMAGWYVQDEQGRWNLWQP